MRRPPPSLLAISDPAARGDQPFAAWVAALVGAGVDAVLIRERGRTDREVVELARTARAVGGEALGVLVHRRADVAFAAGADGVHLPADGLPTAAIRGGFPALLVGRSTHLIAEVEAAAAAGADYVVFGPIWETPSKPGAVPLGLAGLRQAAACGVAVLALGGADAERRAAVAAHGGRGVAGIRLFHGAALERLAAAAPRGAARPA
jgi:thiamine-phosphate diphosphorylase